jgi:putative tricarboxylic transport membrane protein
MFLANVLILILGILSIRLFPKILKTPDSILFPVIFALCFLGAFSLNNSIYDMLIALIFGIIGYIMRKNGFPVAPVVLGVILGPIVEDELGRALIISHGNWKVLFQSPIAIFFYIISILSLLYSLKRQLPVRQKIN